ncbi:MAG: hypothetical protein PXY39_08245 [archaeon]|nr:hypothetical protein [archaeon]
MPARNSTFLFFFLGAILLVVPLIFVIVWDSPICSLSQTASTGASGYCPSTHLFKSLISFFPFLMVIGTVLIGYNLKRISDSLLPPKEETDEDDKMVEES